MGKAAARVGDAVAHAAPSILTGGTGSSDVFISGLPAWRGVTTAVASSLQGAKDASDATIEATEVATAAATGTPGYAAAETAEETTKATAAATMSATIISSAGGADVHTCTTPLPDPDHGSGVVIDGSQTVLINGLPACRAGDTILEAVAMSEITQGCFTVLIGG